MNIGIIGSGDVAKSLASGCLNLGHRVTMGTRNPEKLIDFTNDKKSILIDNLSNTCKNSELIILAVSWKGVESAIKLMGLENLTNKIIIDVTNPLKHVDGPNLALGFDNSGGETIQSLIPHAMVVKALNSVGHDLMINPKFSEGTPDMFICGNDENAKTQVTQLIKSFGWNTIDIGNIEESRLLEPLAMIWIKYGFKYNEWNQAFKLLRH